MYMAQKKIFDAKKRKEMMTDKSVSIHSRWMKYALCGAVMWNHWSAVRQKCAHKSAHHSKFVLVNDINAFMCEKVHKRTKYSRKHGSQYRSNWANTFNRLTFYMNRWRTKKNRTRLLFYWNSLVYTGSTRYFEWFCLCWTNQFR